MKTRYLLCILAIICFKAYSQDSATVFWELTVNTTTSYLTTGGVNASEQSTSEQYIIRDYGGVETSQRVYSAGSGLGYWPNETSENMDRYCEFEVFPRNGITFKLTQLDMRLGNSGGSDKVRASIYYSIDNFSTFTLLDSNIAVPNTNLKNYSYNLSDSGITVSESDKISVRVYPWLQGGVASGKYFNIRDVKITGTTTGEIIPELPGITSVEVYKISTQTARFIGQVTNDGGVSLDSVGLELLTFDGQDSIRIIIKSEPVVGSFEIQLENLISGREYLARAFASNAAGTNYGGHITFQTLASLSVPGVSTQNASDVRPNGAIAHGTVFFDGGLDVSLTGFCFSTQVSPTLNDNVVDAGAGLGAFSAYLAKLEPETTYYVRAFAQNEKGIGFGDQISLTTPAPAPDINIVVDQSGTGDYTTLQDAFNSIPLNYMGNIYVLVKKGIYNEKVILEKGKINVHLQGEYRDSTIIRWDDYSGKVVEGVTLGTSTSYTIAIDADDFIAQNITFQNTSEAAQAVALRVKGDRMIFNACNLLGFQDTYYTWGTGRVYHEDCYIEGTVDFIFGSSIAIFKNCIIKSLRISPVTAAATPENYKFGYVLMNCELVADNISGAYLGRPWKPFAQTVFIETEEGKHISPQGWLEWSGTTNHLTAYYAEYKCTGEGYKPDSRVSWSHQLTDEEAADYTVANIFSKKSASPAYYYDWLPEFEPIVVNPDTTTQNIQLINFESNLKIYPNPVEKEVQLAFSLSAPSYVSIKVYNLYGVEVVSLFNEFKNADEYRLNWKAENLAPGIYVCVFKNHTNSEINRVKLIKK